MMDVIPKKELKRKLTTTTSKDLVKIISQLYDLNKENKLFLTTRLQDPSDGEARLHPYKEIIQQNLYPEIGDKISLKDAKKAISDYRKATGDEDGVLELMIYYLEMGTQCTADFGSMWESYYDSLISVGFQIVKKIKSKKVDNSFMEAIKPRFSKLREDASGIGWGFGDEMAEIYYELFGD